LAEELIDCYRRLDDQGLLRLSGIGVMRSDAGTRLRPDFMIRCVLRGETSTAKNTKGRKEGRAATARGSGK
jgi:hypothetical protein